MNKNFIKLFIITFISITSINTNAQRNNKDRVIFQLGGGYNLGGVQIEGLNNIVDVFNAQNPNADMDYIENVSGVSASLSVFGNIGNGKGGRAPLYFDLMYNNRSQGIEGLNQRLNQIQNIRFRSHNMSLGFGIMPIISDYFSVAIAVSGDLGYNSQLIGLDNESLESIQDDITAGMSVSLPVIVGFGKNSPLELGIRPFYQFQFSEIDFNGLKQEIEKYKTGMPPPPSNDLELTPEDFVSSVNGWGVSFHLYIMLYRQNYR